MDPRDTELAILVSIFKSLRFVQRLKRRLACAALVIVSLASIRAVADDFDTFNILGGSLLRYESNLFKAPDNAGPRADTANVSYIGLSIDKPYSLQRFVVKGTNTYVKYAENNSLDNDSLNYSATWLWAVTPHLTGSLSTDRLQTQIPFSQVGGNQRNIVTTRNQNFTFDATVSGAWHLIGSYGTTVAETEQSVITVPSQQFQRSEGGIRYVSRAGNTITAVYRHIPTHVTDRTLNSAAFIDTDYKDTESELRGDWKLTGKSTITGRVLWKKRTNEHFSQRDFSGTGGELRYIWLPTGKLQINAAISRDYQPYAAFGNTLENSTFRVDNTLAVSGAWKAAAKTTVIARLARSQSEFRGPVFFPVTLPMREDTLVSASVGTEWAISRSVLLNANLQHDQRTSNQQQFQFKNYSFVLGTALKF